MPTTKVASRGAATGFGAGDVVERVNRGFAAAFDTVIEAGAVGTICRVVNPARSYMVRYADVPLCVLVFHDSIRSAPPGTAGPECEEDC